MDGTLTPEALRAAVAGLRRPDATAPDAGPGDPPTATPGAVRLVRLVASDAGDAWLVRLGPDAAEADPSAPPGLTLVEPDGRPTPVDGHAPRPDGIVAGTAEDVLGWLCRRGTRGSLTWTGDAPTRHLLEAAVGPLPEADA